MDHAHHPKYTRVPIQKNESLKKRIAFFDFDGTITRGDTMLELIRYQKGSLSYFLGFILNLPVLVAYKFKIISNSAAKERVLRYFFAGIPSDKFQSRCDQFQREILADLIRPKAIQEIEKLKASHFEIVLVSASADLWIGNWAREYGIKLISTHLEIRDSKITGRLNGKNCHGEEKVYRIRSTYELNDYDEIYCYGDTKGDLPMLALGNISFFRPFR
jgi:HAD superfamily hydrolase (TIGR01490 family)